MERALRRFLIAAGAAVAVTACGARHGSGPPAELEAVEVSPPPDAAVRPEDDVQEERREGGLAGMLPEDFPPQLPVYLPASLIDFGEEEGWRFVVLLSPDPPHLVDEGYRRQVAASGWELEADASRPSDGFWAYRRDESRVRVRIEPQPPSTRLRIDFQPH